MSRRSTKVNKRLRAQLKLTRRQLAAEKRYHVLLCTGRRIKGQSVAQVAESAANRIRVLLRTPRWLRCLFGAA